jgi:hydroxymethylpyrimidine pyrophosphatase-like HAD family hydrolase
MKKLIAFDMDGTLAPSKSKMHDIMVDLLNELLTVFDVLIISGGKYQFLRPKY